MASQSTSDSEKRKEGGVLSLNFVKMDRPLFRTRWNWDELRGQKRLKKGRKESTGRGKRTTAGLMQVTGSQRQLQALRDRMSSSYDDTVVAIKFGFRIREKEKRESSFHTSMERKLRMEAKGVGKEGGRIGYLCVPGCPLSPLGAPTRAMLDMLWPGSATTCAVSLDRVGGKI